MFSYRKYYIDVERKEEGFDLSPARIYSGQFRVRNAGVITKYRAHFLNYGTSNIASLPQGQRSYGTPASIEWTTS